METVITVIHVLLCLFLILVVLFQTGKGAGMGAAFGGGASQTVFGSQGAGSFLGKITAGAAGLFMLTSIALAYMSSSGETSLKEKSEELGLITGDAGLPPEKPLPAPDAAVEKPESDAEKKKPAMKKDAGVLEDIKEEEAPSSTQTRKEKAPEQPEAPSETPKPQSAGSGPAEPVEKAKPASPRVTDKASVPAKTAPSAAPAGKPEKTAGDAKKPDVEPEKPAAKPENLASPPASEKPAPSEKSPEKPAP